MELIQEIQNKVENNLFEFSKHAVDQTIMRNISVAEVKESIFNKSKIIEDYPNDKYGPSCLILGFSLNNRPIHIQCSYPSRSLLKIITLYEPKPEKWVNYERRRKS